MRWSALICTLSPSLGRGGVVVVVVVVAVVLVLVAPPVLVMVLTPPSPLVFAASGLAITKRFTKF